MFNPRINTLMSVVCIVMFLTGCGSLSIPERPVPVVPVNEPDVSFPDSSHSSSAQPESPVMLLIKDKQWAAAEILLKAEIQRRPNTIAAKTNLGLLYADTGRTDDAIVVLSDLTRQHPDACAAQVKLAQLFRDTYRFVEAEAAYQACLSKNSEYLAALLNLGILYELYRGDFTSALVQYERYQASLPQPDLKVEGWIADLSRRSHQIAEAR